MMTPQHPMSTRNQPAAWRRWHQRGADVLQRWISHDLLALAARTALAAIFWLSGRTKVEGWWTVSDSAYELFRTEYRLPLITPELAAPRRPVPSTYFRSCWCWACSRAAQRWPCWA